MQTLKCLLLLLTLLTTTAFAAEPVPPSDESIKELLAVTDARHLADEVIKQMEVQMRASMQQSLQGRPVTPQQQKVIDNILDKVVVILRQELAWDGLEATYLRIYRDSFTQEEIDGMLALYKTPAGQAMVHKMPTVMQRTMVELQARMGPLRQKLRAVQHEAIVELRAQPAR